MRLPILVLGARQRVTLKPRVFPSGRFWPGCSAWMILTHAGTVNTLTAEELRAWLGPGSGRADTTKFDWALASPPWNRATLAGELNLTPAIVDQAVCAAGQQFLAPNLRYCRRCLHQGLHTLAHQWRCTPVCPAHQVPLAEVCWSCGQPVDYRFNRGTFRWPGCCPHCGTRWIAARAVGRPPAADSAKAKALGPFGESLRQWLLGIPDDARREQVARVSAWLTILPGLPSDSEVITTAAVRWRTVLQRLPAGPPTPQAWPAADPAWRAGDDLYRRVARLLWRRLGRDRQRAIATWARSQTREHTFALGGAWTVDEIGYLGWRMTWEARRTPVALFRPRVIPATGIAVWLAYQAVPLAQEDTPDSGRPPAPPRLSPPERQALVDALVATHQQWRQLAAMMRKHQRFLLCPDLVPIPGDVRSGGATRSGRTARESLASGQRNTPTQRSTYA